MRAAAIALVVIGASIAGSFLHRGPSVRMRPVPLGWTSAARDAGELEVQFTVSGVEFGRASDADEPVRSFAVLSRGGQHFATDAFDSFHAVERRGHRLFALGESTTEGPGGALELLVSEDDGATFEHRASIPKPNYLAMFDEWSIEGDELRVVVSLDDALPLSDEWRWPLGPLTQTSLGPGRFILRSKNAGRTWRLER